MGNWKSCFCICALYMAGCASSSRDVPDFDLLNVTEHISEISPYIAGIEAVPLTSDDSVVVSNITKLLVDDNGEMILLTSAGIYRFDNNGRMKTQYGRTGRGPGEYLKIYDICLNERQTELWCLSHLNEVMQYDLATGKYKKSVATDSKEKNIPNASGIAPADDDGFYLFVPNPANVDDIKTDFDCLLKFDGSGKLTGSSMRRTDFNVDMSFIHNISQSYGNVYFIRPQENENICYEISDGKQSEFCRLHFGDRNLPPLYAFKENSNPWQNLGDIMSSNYFKIPFHILRTERHMMVSAFGPQSDIYNFLIDRNTKTGIRWNNGQNKLTTPFFILGSDKEFFYGLFDKYSLSSEHLTPEIDPMLRYLAIEKKLELKYDDNPVIVKIKFK